MGQPLIDDDLKNIETAFNNRYSKNILIIYTVCVLIMFLYYYFS